MVILQSKCDYTLAPTVNAQCFTKSESRKLINDTVQALWFLCKAWDSDTAHHQSRVARLAHAIAGEMDISTENVHGIYMAALLHDIGKMAVPRRIINKPGYLSDNEYGVVRKHCNAGYATLTSMGVIWPIAEAVLQHHERVDGSGYPNGVRDSDLTLGARIICVADVVEAMISHRPYRPSLSIDTALEEISENRCTLYDANVVDACLRLFMRGSYTFFCLLN